MNMNLKPNKHKRISFNTTTMASLGFIGPPKILEPQVPLLFSFEIFRSSPPKIRGGGADTMFSNQKCSNWKPASALNSKKIDFYIVLHFWHLLSSFILQYIFGICYRCHTLTYFNNKVCITKKHCNRNH